jgi:small subunit ribosomal protein S8e
MKLGRKPSGGKYKKQKKRKYYEKQGKKIIVKLGERKIKKQKIRGGKYKTRLISINIANLTDKKTGKTKKDKIKNVIETPNNVFLARQNVLVKNALIETEHGKARITNRPSQEGNVQAVLIE